MSEVRALVGTRKGAFILSSDAKRGRWVHGRGVGPLAAAAPEEDGFLVSAPMVGTFYASSTPGAAPYVQVGDRVSEGDTLCIIEAMKMMNQIEADVSGVIKSIRVQNGEPVEYGQTLFVIDQRASE